ncbi:MFS transporter [Nocardioides alcanivorans]|uniref:MFS transporter n=1 Tax=Nocardioides alcanivorans TaxID=2897352 RepID=UPI001F304975|nr:MFS transporter [Nocardioides alcanivorans]
MTTARVATHEDQVDHERSGAGLFVLSLAAGAFVLAQTTVVPGLGVLSHELNASAAEVGWVLTGYLISAAILTPVFGRLGDMFGKRRMLLVSLLLFTAGSVVAALAPNIWVLVAARVIQGAGGGIFPLCYGIIGDTFPHEKRSTALGLISALAGIGAGAGLVLGGVLMDRLSWPWIFWSGALMAGVALIGAFRLPESPVRAPGRLDLMGVVLLAVGVTAPLLGLSHTASWGWGDSRTLGLFALGALFLVLFVLFELRTSDPLVDMRVLRRPAVLAANVTTLLFGFGMFGVFALVPQIAQLPEATGHGFGLGATGSGLLLVPGCLAMLVAAVVAGRLIIRMDPKIPLVIGALISAAGLGGMALAHGSELSVALLATLTFIGIGLGMAGLPNIIMAAVPADKLSEGTGVNALIRTVGSSIGSQVAATVLAGSVVAGSMVPSDDGFTTSFWIVGGGALVAAFAALFIPRTRAVAVQHEHEVLDAIESLDPLVESEIARR